MDSTVYFATLDQYKYNPALIFGAEEGAQVVSAAKGIVDSITTNDEPGTTIRMNLGDQYTLIYGQLENVAVAEGDVVERGQLLGYVAQPTKYYCKEGTNLYFAMEKDGAGKICFCIWKILMPGSKGLNPHELAHRWMKDLGTRPDMSIKVG